MRPHGFLIAVAAAALTSTAFAQPAPATSGPGKSSGSSGAQSTSSKSTYDKEDCRKDMANAEDAKRAGHITDKEHAEQKKMAQAKMKRDSGQGGGDKSAECK